MFLPTAVRRLLSQKCEEVTEVKFALTAAYTPPTRCDQGGAGGLWRRCRLEVDQDTCFWLHLTAQGPGGSAGKLPW